MYSNKLSNPVALLFVLSFVSAVATASPMSLNPTQSGSITRTEIFTTNGPLPPTMSSSNPLETLQYFPITPFGSERSRSNEQGFLLFDLSTLAYTAETARLEFDLDYARSAAPNLTATSLDPAQAQILLNVPSGTESWNALVFINGTPQEQAAYNRLSSGYNAISGGTQLGALAASGPFNGLSSIDLNSEALSLINSGSGLFGLGLTWTPTVDIVNDPFLGPYESGFDTLMFNAAPRLVLNNANEVPVPATAWLFLSAIGGMGLFRQRAKE